MTEATRATEAALALRKWQRHTLLRTYGDNGQVVPENIAISGHLETLLSVLPPPHDAPAVTDEMVERAAYKYAEVSGQAVLLKDMRAALLAALQPPDQ